MKRPHHWWGRFILMSRTLEPLNTKSAGVLRDVIFHSAHAVARTAICCLKPAGSKLKPLDHLCTDLTHLCTHLYASLDPEEPVYWLFTKLAVDETSWSVACLVCCELCLSRSMQHTANNRSSQDGARTPEMAMPSRPL